jgi:cytochrome P450
MSATVSTGPAVVDLRDAELWQDPYPVFEAARRQHRTARTQSGELIVLSAADAEAASSHPELVPLGLESLDRLGVTDGPFRAWRARSLNAQVGEDHARLRLLVGRAFSPRQVDRVRAMVADFVADRLQALGDGEVDVHHDLGHPVPLFSICAFLGIPVDDRERIDGFMVGTEEGFSYPMTPEKQARADGGMTALYEFVGELVEERSRRPGDDLVSALVAAEVEGDRLSREELLAMVANLIGGAVGSSDAGIANTVFLFARHPAEADAVRADPALIPAAVEEVLRYAPPFRSTRRRAVTDVELAGEHLPAGRSVYISRQAANRDPERWEDPDRFWVGRPPERHLAFGYGPHYCLGQALARLNLTEAMRGLVERWAGIELLGDGEPRRVPFDPAERFASLRVRPRLGARAS